jgi:alkane 1-monooxygenase
VTRYAYLLSLIPTLLSIAGNSLGSWWALAPTAFFAALMVPDWCWQTGRPLHQDDTVPELTLWAQALLQTMAVTTLITGIAIHSVDGWFILAAAYSTGLVLGVGGLTVAHELIHRRTALSRAAGIWLCFLNRYSHYFIEHLENHHRHVASQYDPVTARLGESFYRYITRLGWQQFLVALHIEATRLKRQGRLPYGLGNFAVISTLLEYGFLTVIAAMAGWLAATALFFAGTTARFFLESATYVQHYGLARDADEPIAGHHSWECDSIVSRVMFLELTRHADHHCHGNRRFADLEFTGTSPKLPAGHFGLFPVVLIPPLWFALAQARLGSGFMAKN